MTDAQIPPNSPEAESSTLGAVLMGGRDALATIIERLTETDFYTEAHRVIYQAMSALFERGSPVDHVTLQEELRSSGNLMLAGGPAGISMLIEQGAISAYLPSYVEIVKTMAFRRELIQGCTILIDRAFKAEDDDSALSEYAEQIIFDLTDKRIQGKAMRMNEALGGTFEAIEKAYDNKNSLTGLTTGFVDLNRELGGLQPTDLILVAGRPGGGKTAMGLSLARATAGDGAKVLILSLEMSTIQLVLRFLCSEARVDSQSVKSGYLSGSDWQRLTAAAGRLSNMEIYLDDSAALTVMEARAKARRLQVEKGLDLVIIDYLQLMHGSTKGNREQEVAGITRGLKALAKELKVPVVALSQLSRAVESRATREFRPQLSDLRESGSQEQDADVVLLLYRPSMYREDLSPEDQNIAEIIIAKQRNGPIGTVKVVFLPQYARFENAAAPGRQEPPPPEADPDLEFGEITV